MIYAKDHKTGHLFSPFSHLGEKRLRLLKESWAETFRWDILPSLPVHLLTPYYSIDHGRPTKELFSMMGLMVLQQMHDLTDDEAVSLFAFNLQWHYALNITESDDAHAYVCPRSLWEMRSIMSEHGLEQKVFEVVTDKLAKVYDIDPSLQRLDSTHLCSNMRRLGRISLFVTTIKRFLTNLKRHQTELFTELDKDLRQRYMSKQGDAAFAATTPGNAGRSLQDVAHDLWTLISLFHDQDAITTMTSYKHMVRLFNEQCVETGTADDTAVSTHAESTPDTSETVNAAESDACKETLPVTPKPAKEIPGDSLQNPSDPDATYDGHKGQGYQVQIMETCTESAEEKGLSLITHVAVEPAHIHDSTAVLPAIEESKRNGLAPDRLLADSAYGSDENCLLAAEQGVELIAPTMGTHDPNNIDLDAFTHDDDSLITQCPQNQAPETNKRGKKNGFVAVFSTSACSSCPVLEQCRVKEGKKGFYLRYTKKDLRLAARRAHEKSEEFKKVYAMRAGIEAGNSESKQTTGLGKLRVRGMKAVSFAVTMKLVGTNIRRATAFKLRQNDPKGSNPEDDGSISSYLRHWTGNICRNISKIIENIVPKPNIEDIFAHAITAVK
ncbi:MAG: transposase, partial [Mariprofundales bacterium]